MKSSISKDTPVGIGIEIEARWPNDSNVNPKLQAEIAEVVKNPKLRAAFVACGRQPEHYLHSNTSLASPLLGLRSPIPSKITGHINGHPIIDKLFSPEFRSPEGWERGYDAEIEMRFAGPTYELREAFGRLDRAGQFLKNWGLADFNGCGTHIHLGIPEWTKKVFKPLYPDYKPSTTGYYIPSRTPSITIDVDFPHYINPVSQLYFASREAALFAVTTPHRRTNSNAAPWQYGSLWNPHPSLREHAPHSEQPLWRIHNAVLSGVAPGSWHAGLAKRDLVASGYTGNANMLGCSRGLRVWRRPTLPTFEFRHFAGTANTGAIKGYLALLVSMAKRLEKVSLATDWDNVQMLTAKDDKSFFLPPAKEYGLQEVLAEVEEAGLLVKPLTKWLQTNWQTKDEATPFEANLDEIYATPISRRATSLSTSAKPRGVMPLGKRLAGARRRLTLARA